jgi:hypothetical protein
MGQLAGTVVDEPTKVAAIQKAAQMGVIDPQTAQKYAAQPFDPAFYKSLQTQSMTVAQQVQQQKEQLAAEETKRHNQAIETKPTAEQSDFKDFYKDYLSVKGVPDTPQARWEARRDFKQQKTSQLLTPEEEAQKVRIAKAGKPVIDTGASADSTPDPASASILAQTGLSLRGFKALVGKMSELPRDAASRNAAMKEAQQFANKHGVDVSTLAAQYKTYNEVLSSNIDRLNRTKIMEQELEGTVTNLQEVVKKEDLSKLRFANVAKVWAGQEVNDELAQQYAMHLYQLRNELAAYGAATQGRSGNNITVQDTHEAETTIRNGISSGSLAGLEAAVKNSTAKMGTVMDSSVDRAQKAIWDLFGVGSHYKNKAGATPASPTQQPDNSSDPFAQFGGKKLK